MKLNTAILIDLEYLAGIKNRSNQTDLVSLRNILSTIQSNISGSICIQKAYANWSNISLRNLKKEAIELGIIPVEKMKYGPGSPMNLNQVQILMDAMELSFTKEYIDTHVIVSGENTISSLAIRLTQCGIKVIGCAYEKHKELTNDDFYQKVIWLQNPLKQSTKNRKASDPIVFNYKKKHKTIIPANIEETKKLCKDIISYLSTNTSVNERYYNHGINVSVLSQLFDYRIEGFNYFKFGFTRLIDFVQYLLQGTNCKLVFKDPSEFRMTNKNSSIPGFDDFNTTVQKTDLHTEDFYTILLQKAKPYHKAFSKIDIFLVANKLCQEKSSCHGKTFREVINFLNKNINLNEFQIKNTLFTMKSSACFYIENELAPVAEQIIQYEYKDPQEFYAKIVNSMQLKLEDILPNVDNNIFESLLK